MTKPGLYLNGQNTFKNLGKLLKPKTATTNPAPYLKG